MGSSFHGEVFLKAGGVHMDTSKRDSLEHVVCVCGLLSSLGATVLQQGIMAFVLLFLFTTRTVVSPIWSQTSDLRFDSELKNKG